MKHKFKSLKLYMTILYSILFTLLLREHTLDATTYGILMGALLGYYFTGNVVSKFRKPRDWREYTK